MQPTITSRSLFLTVCNNNNNNVHTSIPSWVVTSEASISQIKKMSLKQRFENC